MQISLTRFNNKNLFKGDESMNMTMEKHSLEAINEHKSAGFVKRTLQKLNGNEKGLTLIELLAVIVILGIIAAIAIPSVNAVIRNSERSAQRANAHQIMDAAKLYATNISFGTLAPGTNPHGAAAPATETAKKITLQDLITAGNIQQIKDPYDKAVYYNPAATFITIVRDSQTDAAGKITDIFSYFVTVTNNAGTPVTYFNNTPEGQIDDTSGANVTITLTGN